MIVTLLILFVDQINHNFHHHVLLFCAALSYALKV